MGADQIAVIRPALNELAQAAQRNEPGAGDLCATFTVPNHPEIWAQVLLGTINIAYPRQDDPLAFVSSVSGVMLPGLAVESWQPETYATFTHEPCSLSRVAELVDQLLIALHALDPEEYPIDVTLEHL